jgi:hypothetical protein
MTVCLAPRQGRVGLADVAQGIGRACELEVEANRIPLPSTRPDRRYIATGDVSNRSFSRTSMALSAALVVERSYQSVIAIGLRRTQPI